MRLASCFIKERLIFDNLEPREAQLSSSFKGRINMKKNDCKLCVDFGWNGSWSGRNGKPNIIVNHQAFERRIYVST